MNKICTSLEQSKKLLELGIDVNTADMCYDGYALDNNGSHPVRLHKSDGEYDTPAWSLTTLLDMLPKIIKHKTFLAELEPLFIETSALLWHIGYRNIYIAKADNLLDAAFEMVCWLKENGKI